MYSTGAVGGGGGRGGEGGGEGGEGRRGERGGGGGEERGDERSLHIIHLEQIAVNTAPAHGTEQRAHTHLSSSLTVS